MREMEMLVTAANADGEYEQGQVVQLANVAAEAFATHGYARFTDPEEQEAFNARFEAELINGRQAEVIQKRDSDAAVAVDEGSVS